MASVLLQRGRLNLREITRFLVTTAHHASTGLMQDQEIDKDQDGSFDELLGGSSKVASTSAAPLRSQKLIQQALLTLIQHNICWHVCILPDGTISTSNTSGSRGIEYFQINVEEVLPRVRFGSYLAIAESRFDYVALQVLQEILHNGKMRARDVVSSLNPDEDDVRADKIRETLRDMLYYAYLKPSIPKMHTSARDRKIAYAMEAELAEKKFLQPKAKQKLAVDAAKQVEEDEKNVWKEDSTSSKRRGLIPAAKKRGINGKGNTKGRVTKKAKTSNGKSRGMANLAVDSDSDSEEEIKESLQIDPEIFLRVNFDRFDVHIRDEIVFNAVEHRYNRTTAEVMKAMLRLNESICEEIPSTKDEQSIMLHIKSIRKHLPEGIVLKKAFDRDALNDTIGSDPTQSALISEIVAVLLGAGDTSRNGVRRRLLSPSTVVKSNAMANNRAPSQLHIEFGNASRLLRDEMMRNVVDSQFGSLAIRIMSLLRDMGKLEEKHISKMMLMPMGETRDVCARLFASSLISLQEVPKSSERIATRTIFFWYVDEKKCTTWLSDHLYRTLSRLIQRRRHELFKESDLLVKSQRTDVINDSSLLNEVEKKRLKRVQETINIITLAELRTWRDLFVVSQLPV